MCLEVNMSALFVVFFGSVCLDLNMSKSLYVSDSLF